MISQQELRLFFNMIGGIGFIIFLAGTILLYVGNNNHYSLVMAIGAISMIVGIIAIAKGLSNHPSVRWIR